MELVLLGSAGWIPTGTRETCCALVRQGSEALVIDAGTGLRRLLTDRTLLDGVRNVTIVLSHFHLDHTAGLTYVAGAAARASASRSSARAPSRTAGRRVEILGDLLRSPLFPVPVERAFAAVHDLDDVAARRRRAASSRGACRSATPTRPSATASATT